MTRLRYEAPRYAVFCLLPLPSSCVQIFSLAHCYQTPSICILPLARRTKFRIHTEQRVKYSFVYINHGDFREETEDKIFRTEWEQAFSEFNLPIISS